MGIDKLTTVGVAGVGVPTGRKSAEDRSKSFLGLVFPTHPIQCSSLYVETDGLTRVKTNRRLPIVLSRDEVWSLLDHVRRPKARMSLTLMYTCGLRVSEAVNLRLEDIDSRRKVVWVRNGKGYKDRSVPLPTQTLAQLRAYWLRHRPNTWLFPSWQYNLPITKNSVQHCLKATLLGSVQSSICVGYVTQKLLIDSMTYSLLLCS